MLGGPWYPARVPSWVAVPDFRALIPALAPHIVTWMGVAGWLLRAFPRNALAEGFLGAVQDMLRTARTAWFPPATQARAAQAPTTPTAPTSLAAVPDSAQQPFAAMILGLVARLRDESPLAAELGPTPPPSRRLSASTFFDFLDRDRAGPSHSPLAERLCVPIRYITAECGPGIILEAAHALYPQGFVPISAPHPPCPIGAAVPRLRLQLPPLDKSLPPRVYQHLVDILILITRQYTGHLPAERHMRTQLVTLRTRLLLVEDPLAPGATVRLTAVAGAATARALEAVRATLQPVLNDAVFQLGATLLIRPPNTVLSVPDAAALARLHRFVVVYAQVFALWLPKRAIECLLGIILGPAGAQCSTEAIRLTALARLPGLLRALGARALPAISAHHATLTRIATLVTPAGSDARLPFSLITADPADPAAQVPYISSAESTPLDGQLAVYEALGHLASLPPPCPSSSSSSSNDSDNSSRIATTPSTRDLANRHRHSPNPPPYSHHACCYTGSGAPTILSGCCNLAMACHGRAPRHWRIRPWPSPFHDSATTTRFRRRPCATV